MKKKNDTVIMENKSNGESGLSNKLLNDFTKEELLKMKTQLYKELEA